MTALAVALSGESGANAKAPTGGNRRGPVSETTRLGSRMRKRTLQFPFRIGPSARLGGAVP
jgi:hypothetical protein